MNNITTFNHEQFGQIRICQKSGKEWFCLSDVCKTLEIGNPSQLRTRLQLKGITTNDTPTYNQYGTLVMQIMNYIDEANLYRCIFKSRKAEAEKFQLWVFEEVLPSIRKHGLYATETALNNLLDNPEEGIKLLQTIKAEREAKVQDDILSFIHSASTVDEETIALRNKIIAQKDPVALSEIAKDYRMNQNDFCQLLAKMNIIHKVAGVWVPYSKFEAEGAVQKNTVTYSTNGIDLKKKSFFLWTQKGRVMIYERLRSLTPLA